MPGPEGPAHRGWLGVVTGIRLIQISTGGFLVHVKGQPTNELFRINQKPTLTWRRGAFGMALD